MFTHRLSKWENLASNSPFSQVFNLALQRMLCVAVVNIDDVLIVFLSYFYFAVNSIKFHPSEQLALTGTLFPFLYRTVIDDLEAAVTIPSCQWHPSSPRLLWSGAAVSRRFESHGRRVRGDAPRRPFPLPTGARAPRAPRPRPPCRVPDPVCARFQERESSRPESRPCRARVLVPFSATPSLGFTCYTGVLKAPPSSHGGVCL